MKKIGILTFHYANNYGAVLQAYALLKVINLLPDCKAEIINYVPEGYSYAPDEPGEVGKKLLIEKRAKFESFLKEKCGVGTPMLSCVEGNEYDYYCVGSDQVWNPDITGKATSQYFFSGVDDSAKRISYAASIGVEKEDIDEILFRQYLSKFQKISLREESYIACIERISGIKCDHVLDPTLLLQAVDYEALIPRNMVLDIEKPFLLFMWYKLDDELMKMVEFVNTVARKYGLAVVHNIVDAPSYMFCNDAGCMMYGGIEEFLWYVKNASFVITNSYHASIFSMQFERPFYIYISQRRRSRLDTLVEVCGISDRVIDGYMDSRRINKNVDFGKIKKRIHKKRMESFEFLLNALEIEESINE